MWLYVSHNSNTAAAPRLIQWSEGLSLGKSNWKIKLVECPVGKISPSRICVLYTGHGYR